MIIRTGEPRDAEALLSLITELAHFEKEPHAVVLTKDDLLRDGFGQNPMFYTFVAEIDQQIVGMALYYHRYSTWKGKTIHLEDLIVRENYRQYGIGMKLYTQVLKQAQQEGVLRIEWNVLDWNENAIAFYEKTGANVLPDWRVVHMNQENLNAFLTGSDN